MIPRYRLLQERLSQEWREAQRAAQKAQQAFELARAEPDPTFLLDSVALNLHGFYNGVERLFEIVAREIDGGSPSGTRWHHDLLDQMVLDVKDVRPPLIEKATQRQLDEYLRFRHLIRNLYTWNFEPTLIERRINELQPTLSALDADLQRFLKFLDAAALADEGS